MDRGVGHVDWLHAGIDRRAETRPRKRRQSKPELKNLLSQSRRHVPCCASCETYSTPVRPYGKPPGPAALCQAITTCSGPFGRRPRQLRFTVTRRRRPAVFSICATVALLPEMPFRSRPFGYNATLQGQETHTGKAAYPTGVLRRYTSLT